MAANGSLAAIEVTSKKAQPENRSTWLTATFFALGIAFWWLVYSHLLPAATWITSSLLRLDARTHLGAAVQFFAFEVPKVLMLLALVVFGVGIIRTFFTPERTRAILAGKRESTGNALASLLGVVTPFCSCSAVPLFIGFVTTGVPLGVTFSFLIAAPMINEVALVLLFGLFGWRVAAIYAGTGLVIAMVAGWTIGRLKLERFVEPWVYQMESGPNTVPDGPMSWSTRTKMGSEAVRDIVGRVWLYVVAGIAVGAGIHGYVPENFMAHIMGKGAWWSVPVAVLIGVPMYSNAAGIIPIVQALWKGCSPGHRSRLHDVGYRLSLPETIILRKVLRPQLIAVFVAVVAAGILLGGLFVQRAHVGGILEKDGNHVCSVISYLAK